MGISDSLVGILNFLTLLLSLPVIGIGIWLARQHNADCYHFLQGPVTTLGVFILLLSLAGFVGSCCRLTCLLWLYLVVMLLLIVLLFAFTVFAFVVTNKTAGDLVANKGYKEYKLGDYSTWLRRQVGRPSNWGRIKSCIAASKLCDRLREAYPAEGLLANASLTPVQSGCCKPPSECQCRFVNATFWRNCSNLAYSKDCATYRPEPTTLCLDCDSCRAGVLHNITKDWRRVAEVNIVMLVFFVVVYSVGCCAFKNVKRSNYKKGRYP